MKKISIVLAILAVFLVFSCSNAAEPVYNVDLAGNPIDLAGTWSGSVPYESKLYPANVTSIVDGVDYTGTWVKEEVLSEPKADFVSVSTKNVDGTVYTTRYNYFYNDDTKTRTTTRVIASDGSYVETVVTSTSHKERAQMTVPTDTASVTNYYIIDGSSYTSGAVIPAVKGGVEVETETKTVTYTELDNGNYDITTVTKTDSVESGAYYTTPDTSTTTKTTVDRDQSDLTFDNFTRSDYVQTPTGKTAPEYRNDILETVTFAVANDGTYTLTTTVVETQEEAEAIAESATSYAAPARAASTVTKTTVFTGTVAAWEVPATSNTVASMKMVLSSTNQVVVKGDYEGELTSGVSKFAASGEKPIRFFNGEGEKDDVVKTRMLVTLDTNGDGSVKDECVIILDKAEEE